MVARLPVVEGESLVEGDVVLEVAGRPVFVLEGELPEYRSLGPGMEGPDVRQLELALVRLGYDPGSVDGVYSVETGVAVGAFYRDAGYGPNEPSSDETAQVKTLEDRIAATQRSISAAKSSSSGGGVPRSQVLALDQQIVQAAEAVDDAKRSRSSVVAEAEGQLGSVRQERDEAQQQVDAARQRLSVAQDGTHPDTGEAPTGDELVLLEAAVMEAEAVLVAADSALVATSGDFEQVKVEQDRTVRDAETQLRLRRCRSGRRLRVVRRVGVIRLASWLICGVSWLMIRRRCLSFGLRWG